MRRAFVRFMSVAMFCLMSLAPMDASWAQDYAQDSVAERTHEETETTAETAKDTVESSVEEATSGLRHDLKEAKDLLLGKGNDSPFARGLLVALFQPIFLASMFCLGLWAGQMSTRLSTIWMLPVFTFGAIVLGAFIATYHSDWKPEFNEGSLKFLSNFQSTDTGTLLVGLLIGAAVGLQLLVAPLFAIIGVVAAGLWLGFSQTAELGQHHNALIPFWAGFGLTGLMINIFGIGFETFLQSIRLPVATRIVGIATLLASAFFVAKIL